MDCNADECGAWLDNAYYLERLVATSSRSLVYRALDRAGRTCALKVARTPGRIAERANARERTISDRVSGPHLRSAIRDGVLSDGRPYLEMEWVEGCTLMSLLPPEGPGIPVDAAIGVGIAAARGLITLHGAKVIHRDVKPANILIPSDADGAPDWSCARLVDFDVSRIVSRDRVDDRYVGFGEVMGTVDFMAPEQLTGNWQDARVDIFGLGATLYYALFHRMPWRGELERVVSNSGVPRSFAGSLVLARLTEEAAMPLSHAVPAAITELLIRVLKLDPSERPQSMADVLVELTGIHATLRR
jgi:eukaryotic-like serine/threonine-protein kinase